jgi:MFS superfamily sulfate permease-like transporter
MKINNSTPSKGIEGLKENWRNELLAAISVSLVAFRLALGIAVNKLNLYKSTADLNKDPASEGLINRVSRAFDRLAFTTMLVRSIENLNSNITTKWFNLYHGIFLIIFVLILAPILRSIPLVALVTILLHKVFKLDSPNVFKQAYKQGVEQLLFLSATLIIALFINLLYVILGGTLVTLILHMLLAKFSFVSFFKMIYKSGSKLRLLENNAQWKIANIIFNMGTKLAMKVYQIRVQIVGPSSHKPKFIIDKEELFNKLLERVRAFSRSNRDISSSKHLAFLLIYSKI